MENNIEKTAIEIGCAMLEAGAEISRCEDTMNRLLKAYKRRNINVFCISSLIIIQTEVSTEIRRIGLTDLNLFGIDEANSKSRAICCGSSYKKELNKYSNMSKIILTILATGSFCIYFGGSIYDAVFAGMAGLILNAIKINIPASFPRTLCYSVIGGFLCLAPCCLIKGLHIDKIMIGSIMLLIPGLTIANAIRDIMSYDIISGITELTDAIFTALAIALGYGVALMVYANA